MTATLEREAPASAELGLLPGEVSAEIVGMIERVRHGVVEVRSRGRGGGAGVIWRADGAIVTNQHVVEGSRDIEVHLLDGRVLPAKVVNGNSTLDLALLQVEATDLPAVPVGDSTKLRVGELVVAVGHPWGQKGAATLGIVSGLGHVSMPRSGREAQYIRSDVRLAPGNSGGPLLDAHGTVVGVNAMIFGGDMGVAIPSHVAVAWVAGPPSRRVFLGVGVQPVELPLEVPHVGRARAAGLLLVAIEPGGPAERAGLHVGDVLLSVVGQPVPDGDSLLGALAQWQARESVQLKTWRAGSLRDVDVELDALEQDA